jgi:hypothetical protein
LAILKIPLIKSEAKEVAQVIEDMGNPFLFIADADNPPHPPLFQFVALQIVLSQSLTP